MDPRHRDRIAFLRVCSGRFERDMAVTHVRTGKKVRLSSPQKLFAQERETVDEAFPGDIVGLVGHDAFGIGDTLSDQDSFVYDEIPRFAPECFAYLRNPQTAKFKQFRQGLDQLLQEGVIQVFHLRDAVTKVPLLAAVGPLQFEVVQYRLQSEYGAESRLETAPWDRVRWLPTGFRPGRRRRPQAAHRGRRGRGHRRSARAAFPERMVDALLPRAQRGCHPPRHPASQGNRENRIIGGANGKEDEHPAVSRTLCTANTALVMPPQLKSLFAAVAATLLMSTPVFADPDQPTQDIFKTLLSATISDNYDAFVSVCDNTMKAAITKTQLDAVSSQVAPRAKDGYDPQYLGELNQRGFAVHLWRLRFKAGGDDVLATLSVKDGKAGGFYLR